MKIRLEEMLAVILCKVDLEETKSSNKIKALPTFQPVLRNQPELGIQALTKHI